LRDRDKTRKVLPSPREELDFQQVLDDCESSLEKQRRFCTRNKSDGQENRKFRGEAANFQPDFALRVGERVNDHASRRDKLNLCSTFFYLYSKLGQNENNS
jgi:hypothetical protein